MVVSAVEQQPDTEGAQTIRRIDCDVHQNMKSLDNLFPHLPAYWVDCICQSGFKGWNFPDQYPRLINGGIRADAIPADGSPAGSDLDMIRSQLLDAYDIEYAILNSAFHENLSLLPNPDFATALASAYNDWLIEAWLSADRRLKGSMLIAVQDPAQAVREIERVGGHPAIVQVLLPIASRTPYGQRSYWPIYEAAAGADLVLGFHASGMSASGNPPTPVGWPSFYIEMRTTFALAFIAQVASLVCQGVFEKLPRLRVALIEGGISWLLYVMWKLDNDYKSLRSEVPWLRRLPSEYIFDHIRLTTQPVDEPKNEDHLLQFIEMIGGTRMLMYSSDYPHWDFDSPVLALPRKLTEPAKRLIYAENARHWYRL